jgi:PilZ domain
MGSDRDRDKGNDRRAKHRFAIERELRFKVLDSERITTTGIGNTVDISSGGVAFETMTKLVPGSLVEISISWPVLLDETCLMRLVVLGRVVRTRRQIVACTVDKYEFRTQARVPQNAARTPIDPAQRRWALSGDYPMPLKAATIS